MTCKWCNHHRAWKGPSGWQTEKSKVMGGGGLNPGRTFMSEKKKSELRRKLRLKKRDNKQSWKPVTQCIFNSSSFVFWWTYVAPEAGSIWRPSCSRLQPSIYRKQWARNICKSLVAWVSVWRCRLKSEDFQIDCANVLTVAFKEAHTN